MLGEAKARVLVVSVDGLVPGALKRLGRAGAPNFHRLKRQGAYTLNARTQVEMTTTLPNHTSMVTGRRISRKHRGHGVTWNYHRPGSTVQKAAGHPVASIFSVLRNAGMNVALFAAKQRFSLFRRSWPAINRVTIREENDLALTRAARSDLIRRSREFTFLHLAGPDHTRLANYRVPFMVWGPGVSHANLYDLNPAYRSPGTRRVRFSGKQPIRNGDVANFSADLLGVGPVPDSLWDAQQKLRANGG